MEAEAKLQDNLDFWKPVHDILMEAAATYPSKIILNLCTLTSRTRWHAVRDGANSGFHLARFTSRVVVGDNYKTRASGTVPADLIPEVMNILADIIRK